VNYARSLGFMILALAITLISSVPATTAPQKAPKGAKQAHAPKKAAPKPKHQPKQHVKAKAPHRPNKGSPVHKNKKSAPKPKHHATPRIKPNTHKASNDKKAAKVPAKNQKNAQVARSHARLVNRNHEWSRNSKHEHTWSRSHWHTHRFVHFHGEGNNAGFQFDGAWWNNYVANPGAVNWSDDPQVVSAPLQPNVAVAPPVIGIDRGLPLSGEGEALAKLLDSIQVESHWLAYQEVDWKTGTPVAGAARGPASNGGAFVAAVCDRLMVSLPASEAQDFLPANQIDWLLNVGKMKGWVKVGEVESQVLANQGWVVIAAWKNMAPAGKREISGQMAIVRPDRDPVSELASRGPRVILAGAQNHNSIALKDAFPPAAWSNQEVVYLAHRSR
jgi:hypothetical protein